MSGYIYIKGIGESSKIQFGKIQLEKIQFGKIQFEKIQFVKIQFGKIQQKRGWVKWGELE